jgi:hypothetical protein
MDSRPLGIAALAVGIIAAAGMGSYLALRPSQAATTPASVAAPAAQTQPGTPVAAGSATGQKPVAETEGTVASDSKVPASAQPVEAPRTSNAGTSNAGTANADTVSSSSSNASNAANASKKASRNDPAAAAGRRVSPAGATASAASGRSAPPVATMARRDPNGPYGPNGSNGGSGSYGSSGAPAGTYGPGRDLPLGENPANRSAAPATGQTAEMAPPPPQEAPAPPKPRFEDLVLPADSVLGLRIEDSISSETARVEDRVEARVIRDMRVNGEVAVPAGSRVRGNVTLVEQGGKFKERARLGVRFHTLVLADGSTVPIQTETVYREGDEMANKSAAKIGGAAVGGAIIGAIFGGGKGAAIGGAAGAGAGTAATMAGPRSHATLAAGSTVTVRLSNPATVTIEK